MVLWIRSILAVVAGLVSAFVVVAVGEHVSHAVFPVPAGVDLSSHDAIRVAMNEGGIPNGALVSLVAVWAIAALAGGWVAALTATRAKLLHAIIFGILLLATTISILLHLPHPLWIWVTGIVEILPAAYLGGRLGLPRVAGQELPGGGKLT